MGIGRLGRIWRTAGAFDRRDPTLFIVMLALWMALSGISLLGPGSIFTLLPGYRMAREMGLEENFVGVTMLANAATLLWGLGERPPGVQAWLALVSGALWVFWSLLMVFSGLQAGVWSATALWTLVASFALMRTTARRMSENVWRAHLPSASDQPPGQP